MKTVTWTAHLEGALEQAGTLSLLVTGQSMAPLLCAGDRIEVVPYRDADPIPGDVLLLGGPQPVIHRFLYRTTEGLVTRGDGSTSHDFPWPESRVLGKVTKRYRGTREIHLDRGWWNLHGRILAIRKRIRRRVGSFIRIFF